MLDRNLNFLYRSNQVFGSWSGQAAVVDRLADVQLELPDMLRFAARTPGV
jgi:hypothetical protein